MTLNEDRPLSIHTSRRCGKKFSFLQVSPEEDVPTNTECRAPLLSLGRFPIWGVQRPEGRRGCRSILGLTAPRRRAFILDQCSDNTFLAWACLGSLAAPGLSCCPGTLYSGPPQCPLLPLRAFEWPCGLGLCVFPLFCHKHPMEGQG